MTEADVGGSPMNEEWVDRHADRTESAADQKWTVGVVLVHGIGNHTETDSITDFAKGLDSTAEGYLRKESEDVFTSHDRVVHLYEAHWSDVARKARGRFDLEMAGETAWFPALNASHGMYPYRVADTLRVMLWTPCLFLVTAALQFLYRGAVLLTSMFWTAKSVPSKESTKERVKELGHHLAELRRDFTAKKPGASERPPSKPAVEARKWIDAKLDIAGDVFNYVEATVQPAQEDHAKKIDDVLRQALDRAAKQCDEIQIVAHSLGSVMTHRCLAAALSPDAESPVWVKKLSRVYSIGCPLEKIRFFWPKVTDHVVRSGPELHFTWINFYDPLDLVSGRLKHFTQWGCVANHRVWGMGGLATAHQRHLYVGHPAFQRLVVSRVVGRFCPVGQNAAVRAGRLLLVLAENVVVVAILLAALAAGVGSTAGVFLLFLWKLPDYWPWVAAGGVLGMYLLAFWLASYARALTSHKAFRPVRGA